MTIHQAASTLATHFGYPSWLACIAVGGNGPEPAIIVFLKGHPRDGTIPAAWEGFPVVEKWHGEFAVMGGPT